MSKRYKKKNKTSKIIISIFFIAVIAIILYYLYITYQNIDISESNYQTERTQSTIEEQSVENVVKNSENVADILEDTMYSVVGISKLKDSGSSIFSSSNETLLGLGTGIIVSEDGYILSNEHVTGSKLSTCYITLENGKKYDGTVMWSDSDLDLSITKIDAKNLEYIELGDSSKIRVGETVYAIGNPIGFEFRRTVTSGIISAKNRSIKLEENENVSYMSDLIQTDATINPGNSGGPLINPSGEVIGINTVKISSAEGIGFAIPINVVKPVIESFKNTGEFEQATMGVYVYDKEVIPYLDSNISFSKGIYVAQITKNSPADNSELKEGDIITAIDSKEVNSMNGLREYIYTKKPGDVVSLQISRGRVNKTIEVTLREKVRQRGLDKTK
jgi:S1-C subfamily serine protease